MQQHITGKTLIDWGYEPGPWFSWAIEAARDAQADGRDIRAAIDACMPPPPGPVVPLRAPETLGFTLNIRAENALEESNIAAVEKHMVELMRVPTIVAGTV